METVGTVESVRARIAAARRSGHSIGFVPTMGNLHAGHLDLVDAARARTGFVVASVFVNPLQFGPNEDLDAYPRTLAADQKALSARGTALLFAPTVRTMYPHGMEGHARVSVPEIGDILCGASRPGHFDGVATVVAKLLNIVGPDAAVFGEKDFQQLTVIRRMVADLALPVRIVGVPIARAADGLALSSRNAYLSDDERRRAPALHRALDRVAERLAAGNRDLEGLVRDARAELEEAGFRPDYVSIRRRGDLVEAGPDDRALVVLGAAHLGRARLIDNVQVDVP